MEQAVIVSAVRTPVGQLRRLVQGRLGDRARHAMRSGRRSSGQASSPEEVDEVILGCVLQAGLGQNPARQAAHRRRHPEGGARHHDQHAVRLGPEVRRARVADDPRGRRRHRRRRRHGEHDARALPAAERALRRAHGRRADDRLDGARRPHGRLRTTSTWASPPRTSPSSTASRREEQDEFAAPSQQKAEQRHRVAGSSRRRSSRSRCPRRRATDARRERRAPARRHDRRGARQAARRVPQGGGTVTAGNASGINDGAVGDRRDVGSARRRSAASSRLGIVESYASVGVEPRSWASVPCPRCARRSTKVGLGDRDVDLFELNEAFAAQSLAVLRELGIADGPRESARRRDRARASDRRQRRAHPGHAAARDEAHGRLQRGVATLCVGGGQGQAAMIRSGSNGEPA